MTIALAMIVKDEAPTIVRCLEAATKVVDSFVIEDTGSMDGTPEIIQEWAEQAGVQLKLVREPWVNFKVNRTSLFRHAETEADWLLLLDADLVVHAPDPMPDLERADSWHGMVKFAGLEYTLPFIVRSGKPWYYEGVAHSYLACEEGFDESVMDGLWVDDYSHTTNEKLERDLVALLADHSAHPANTRTVFYLAQTYYDLDRFHEAIHYYRMRADMEGGWDEERYFSRYRLGCLLSEHVDFARGAKELLRAWEERPNRIEALRALAGCATSVANKVHDSSGDRLFVGVGSYLQHELPRQIEVASTFARGPDLTGFVPFPSIAPKSLRKRPLILRGRGLAKSSVSAIVVTRGNVPEAVDEIVAGLPFNDVVVWDNSKREHDYKPFGRYAAIPETKNPVIFWVDDDVIFTAFDELLAAYVPGKLVCNMDESWIDGAGYRGLVGMQGAGSLCDASLPSQVWARYLASHPWDEEALIEADFVFGTLVPFKVVDLGYDVRPFADDPDRLYTQPGQTERKRRMINRCRALLEREQAAV